MPKTTTYPKRYGQTLGDVSIDRGNQDNMRLYSWDAVNDCINEDCVADQFCKYERKGKCRIQLNYLRAFSDVMFTNFSNVFKETDFYYIGMHLTPLYKTLCKLKIEELAIARVVNVDEKGIRRVNPVYKEIRETIKLINILWKSLGMTRGPGIDIEPDFGNGHMIDGDTGEVSSPMDSRKKKLVKRR